MKGMDMYDEKNKEIEDLLRRGIAAADAFGLGYISSCKEVLEQYELPWKPEYERFIFNQVVEVRK